MSIFQNITVLNKVPRTKQVGGIVIDGLLEEIHSRKSTVTRIPVEEGVDISDHIKNDPDSLSIRGTITNTPLLLTLLQSSTTLDLFGDRVTQAFESIERLRDQKALVTVGTALKVYNNMAIESFTPVKDQTTGQSMNFTMTLVRISKVTNQVVPIPNSILGGDFTTDQLQAQNNINQGQTVGINSEIVNNNSDSILADVAAQLGAL